MLLFWLSNLVALDLLFHYTISYSGLVLLMRHGMPREPSAYWQLEVQGLDFWQGLFNVFFATCFF